MSEDKKNFLDERAQERQEHHGKKNHEHQRHRSRIYRNKAITNLNLLCLGLNLYVEMMHLYMNVFRFPINNFVVIHRGTVALLNQHQLKAKIHTSSHQNAKKVLPFEYVEPKKDPVIFRKWDLEELKKVDVTEPQAAYKHSVELNSDTCSEAAKKILSLGFATKAEINDEIKRRYLASVQKHCLDTGSYESTIAALTIKVRTMQIHLKTYKGTAEARGVLKSAIERRNKFLNRLRKTDLPRFEWLVKELKIVFVEPPRYQYAVDRKSSIREMTQKHCEDIRMTKIEAIRKKLQDQRADFLKEKEEKLRFIAEEEKELGIISEIEVTQLSDEERHSCPVPVASSLLQIARTAEGPYVEPPYVKRKPK